MLENLVDSLWHQLGQHGMEQPIGPPPSIGRERMDELVQIALRGLEAMYDPSRELLGTRQPHGGSTRVSRDSYRYTVMASLGVSRALRAGYETFLDPHLLLRSAFNQNQRKELGFLGLSLWADAALDGQLADEILPSLFEKLDDDSLLLTGPGRTRAFALAGLCFHAARAGNQQQDRVTKAARKLRDLAVYRHWCSKSGLFEQGESALPTLALFPTQAYWIFALSVYGRLFGDNESLKVAAAAADTLAERRDPFGGWPFRYHARTGRVLDRYPLYSVHQSGLAPMALFALSEASGYEVEQLVTQSVAWLWRNELGVMMVDGTKNVVYRGIRRRPGLGATLAKIDGVGLPPCSSGECVYRPWFLSLDATCRPYHLGWILYAWAERLDRYKWD